MKRELYLNASSRETRVVLIEDGLPVEVFVERSEPSLVGNIYKGQVSKVLAGMQSAFVNIGLDRDVFLYATEVVSPDLDVDVPERGERVGSEGRARPSVPLEQLLRPDQEVMVQITKDALGSKAPRVTTQLSVPGRKLVYLPDATQRTVSHRIENEDERERLRALAAAIPGEGGFIVRTMGAGSGMGELEREAAWLREKWREVDSLARSEPLFSCVHREPPLAVRVLRDLLGEDVHRAVIDDEETLRICREYAEKYMPKLAHRIEAYVGSAPLFEAAGIEKELKRALRPRVWLPSGGYIVIHPTEALVAIDVNTGKFVGKGKFEETALRVNLEAAREIVRQIRLRDLGGILVVDFIDLEEKESRARLGAELEAALARDRARSRVLQINEFGLAEITRQRTKPSLEAVMCRPCPSCRGSGRILTAESLHLEVLREIQQIRALCEGGEIQVRVHPGVKESLENLLARVGEIRGRSPVRLVPVDTFGLDQYEIVTGAGEQG